MKSKTGPSGAGLKATIPTLRKESREPFSMYSVMIITGLPGRMKTYRIIPALRWIDTVFKQPIHMNAARIHSTQD